MWSVWLEDPSPLQKVLRRQRPRLQIGAPSRRELPLPGSQWVRVKNTLAGITPDDIALIDGNQMAGLPLPPRRYLGSEVVGIVSEVGADVVLARVGDQVVLQTEPTSSCTTLRLNPPCRACAVGNMALCEHRTLPWAGTGAGWSDSMIVHESQLFPVPQGIAADQAVLLAAAGRALRAVLQRIPEPGSEVLVIGGGVYGQLTLAAIRAVAPGVHCTVASSLNYEVTAARGRGITSFISGGMPEMVQEGAEMMNAQIFRQQGRQYILGGYDSVYLCSRDTRLFTGALELVRNGGALTLIEQPERNSVNLDGRMLWRDEITVMGIASTGADMLPEDIAQSIGPRSSTVALAARLIQKNRIDVQNLVSHREPYLRINEALTVARDPLKHQAMRVALVFDRE